MTNLMHRISDLGTRRAIIVALVELGVVIAFFVATMAAHQPAQTAVPQQPQATTDWIAQLRP